MQSPAILGFMMVAALWIGVPVQADPLEVIEECLNGNPCNADLDDFVCISSPGPYGVSSPFGCIGPCDDSLETYNLGSGCEPLPVGDDVGAGTCESTGNLPIGIYVRVGSTLEECVQNVQPPEGIEVEPCSGGLRVKLYSVSDECHEIPESNAGLCDTFGGPGVFVQLNSFGYCLAPLGPCLYRYNDGVVYPGTCV